MGLSLQHSESGMIDLRYIYNDQPVAEGERAVIYQAGRLYVRTGVKSIDPATGEITYRMREVYVAVNQPPAGGNVALQFEVPAP